MTVRIDPSLAPAHHPAPPGALGGAEPPVVRPGVASSNLFLVEGERLAVTGRERTGEHTVWLGGEAVVANLATSAGPGMTLVAAPSSLRRELAGAGATLMETTLVASALPLAAVQWSPPQGGRSPDTLVVGFSVLPRRRDVRYHVHETGLRASADEAPQLTVDVRLHPPPGDWSVMEGPDGGLGVRADVARGGKPVTLVVAAAAPAELERAVAAGAHLGAHEIRAAADADPGNRDTLTLESGVPDLDHGVVWAAGRVRRGLLRHAPSPGEDVFWAGLGALAAGDDEAAFRAVEALTSLGPDSVAWALGGAVEAEALAILLGSRITLLSGNAGLARDLSASLTPSALEERRRESDRTGWALWSLALTTLADALRHAAPEPEVQHLRRLAEQPPGRGGVTLPMVGGPSAPVPSGANVLAALLSGQGLHPDALPATAARTPLGCWASWVGGDPDEAYTGWRGLLGAGLVGSAYGRGLWDDVTSPPGAPAQAGLLLAGLAHGLLGLSPDAPSGRIRMAPRLPGHLTRFQVREIRVGEAHFTFRYQRDGDTHSLSFTPTRGRVPPMLVLEPSLPIAATAGIRVDGEPAELDTTPEAGRTRVRIQIPLDGPRTLEVDGASGPSD